MTDVLQGGSDRPPVIRRFPRPSWRRTAGAVMVAVLAAVVVIFVLVEVNPFARSAPLTNVDLLVSESQVTEGDRLTWISVDDQTVSVVSDNVEVDETYTVGDGEVILQLPNPDRIFADSVVSIDREGATRQVGEADRVVVDPTSGLWLVVDSSGHTRGGVALTNTTGAWRSRVFTVPVHRQVVGATTDALVTLDGQERNRRLQLWDPQLSEVIADLGDVTGVLDVQADSILVGRGCLVLGCDVQVIDAHTGGQQQVRLPAGWLDSGPARLVDDGHQIVQVVRKANGRTGLVVGPPEHPSVVAGVTPQMGAAPFVSQDGWIAVTNDVGDVVVVRGDQRRVVHLDAQQQLIGVRE